MTPEQRYDYAHQLALHLTGAAPGRLRDTIRTLTDAELGVLAKLVQRHSLTEAVRLRSDPEYLIGEMVAEVRRDAASAQESSRPGFL